MAATRGKRRKGRRPPMRRERKPVEWNPITKLGKLVRSGQIKTMSDVLKSGLPLREPEVVDVLIPEINDEVIDVNMVQRMTDSGRRVKFVISVAVGNNDGFVGFGQAKGKEVGISIRKAIQNAKLNMIEIRRGCGSWECGCKKPHTVPFAVKGKSGSVEVTLKPAPQGIGLATGNVAKKILTLAGVQDCWTFTKGKTKTTVNYAKAVFNALEQNTEMRVMKDEINKIGIISGSIGIVKDEKQEAAQQPPVESQPVAGQKPESSKPDGSKAESKPAGEPKEEKPVEDKPAEEPKEEIKKEETKEEPAPAEEAKDEPVESKPEAESEKQEETEDKPVEDKPAEEPKEETIEEKSTEEAPAEEVKDEPAESKPEAEPKEEEK